MKTKQAAMQAARKKLGAAANEGVDFTCTNTGAGWAWTEIPAANEPAAKAKAKRAPKVVQKTAAKAPPTPKATKTPPKPPSPRAPQQVAPAAGTKGATLMQMLRTPGGANSSEMEAATGWKAASVRGYLGTLRAQGHTIESKKHGKGEAVVYKLVEAKAPVQDVGDVV